MDDIAQVAKVTQKIKCHWSIKTKLKENAFVHPFLLAGWHRMIIISGRGTMTLKYAVIMMFLIPWRKAVTSVRLVKLWIYKCTLTGKIFLSVKSLLDWCISYSRVRTYNNLGISVYICISHCITKPQNAQKYWMSTLTCQLYVRSQIFKLYVKILLLSPLWQPRQLPLTHNVILFKIIKFYILFIVSDITKRNYVEYQNQMFPYFYLQTKPFFSYSLLYNMTAG
jgi:hypothetical protein